MAFTEKQKETLRKFKRAEQKKYTCTDEHPEPTIDMNSEAPKSKKDLLMELAQKCHTIISQGGLERARELMGSKQDG